MSEHTPDDRDETMPDDERAEIAILRRLGELSFEQLAAAYRDIELRLAPTDASDRALAVRRRVARGLLRAACVKQRTVEECEALLGAAESLGFATLYERAMVVFPFCGYCSSAERPDIALRHLPALIADIESCGAAWTARILPDLRELMDALHRP